MELKLLMPDEVRAHLCHKLKSGYMMFAGDSDAIGNIENSVYPPKTKLNGLFEVCMHPLFPGGGFALGKRTEKLKEFLHHIHDYDKTLIIIFHKKISEKDGKVQFLAQQIYRNQKKPIDYSINAFLNRIFPEQR